MQKRINFLESAQPDLSIEIRYARTLLMRPMPSCRMYRKEVDQVVAAIKKKRGGKRASAQ